MCKCHLKPPNDTAKAAASVLLQKTRCWKSWKQKQQAFFCSAAVPAHIRNHFRDVCEHQSQREPGASARRKLSRFCDVRRQKLLNVSTTPSVWNSKTTFWTSRLHKSLQKREASCRNSADPNPNPPHPPHPPPPPLRPHSRGPLTGPCRLESTGAPREHRGPQRAPGPSGRTPGDFYGAKRGSQVIYWR